MRGRRKFIACAVLLLLATLASAAQAASIQLPRPLPSFNQAYDSGPEAWGNDRLGTGGCPDRIETTGCLVTAFASVLAYYGIDLSIPARESSTGSARTGMDPGILNDWLRANAGYGSCSQDPAGNCCLSWENLPAAVSISFHENRSDVGLNPVSSVVIDHAIRQGNPVIAGVHWGATCTGSSVQSEDCHWVVIQGRIGEDYVIMDPYNPDTSSRSGVRTTLSQGVRGSYVIDRFVVVTRTSAASPLPDTEERWSDGMKRTAAETAAAIGTLFAALVLIAATVLLVTSLGSQSTP